MNVSEGAGRRPEWLKKRTVLDPKVLATRSRIRTLGLSTVCEEARCPNLSECFGCGIATFMILGDRCTRGCRFCAVMKEKPAPPDPEEGKGIAGYIRENGIRYAVITSVTRDDLPDGGAGHFRKVVLEIVEVLPDIRIEILVPDFGGDEDAVRSAAGLPVTVFGHNLETVPRLYPEVRSGADYRRSLRVLETAGRAGRALLKTGIMVGLGETRDELRSLFRDAAGVGVSIISIGQYLQPSRLHAPVVRYVPPVEFEELERIAREEGIEEVAAGPYVRSSYLAEQSYSRCRGKGFDK